MNNKQGNNLIDGLIREGYLKTSRIIDAFRAIDRADFVPDDLKSEAYINAPLPIGRGQTISQPLTVAFMQELLEPQGGDKILDIGSGSGWQTALMAHIVGPKGKVFAIELIPEIMEFGKGNVAKYNFIEKGIVKFLCLDGSKGLPGEAPFDKIIAAAAAEKIPEAWKKQLKVGGKLVTPVGSSIWLLEKIGKDKFKEKEFPGFAFVPFISK